MLLSDAGYSLIIIEDGPTALSGSIPATLASRSSLFLVTSVMILLVAAVIIGTTIFRKLDRVRGTTAVIVGSVIYKACIQAAISLGLPANLLKLITAVLFLVILAIGTMREKGGAANA